MYMYICIRVLFFLFRYLKEKVLNLFKCLDIVEERKIIIY